MKQNDRGGRRLVELNICDFGSTGRLIRDLSTALNEKEWETRCAFGRYKDPSHKPGDIIIGSGTGVKAHYAHSRLTGRTSFGHAASYNATRRLVAQLKEYSPDVIHMHNLHGHYLNMPVLFDYLKESGVRTVWTLHDCWAFTGNCGYFEKAGCDFWKEGCHDCPQRRTTGAKALFVDASAANWRQKKQLITELPPEQLTLVTPCEWLAGYVRQSFMRDYPLRVIYNGVERSSFKPTDGAALRAKYGLADRKILVGVAAIWDHRKGLWIIEQLAELLGDGYAVAAIGLTEKQIAALSPKVIGIKRTESVEELAMWYSEAEAFINPTLEDNFPSTNIEALSCGTPVVTFRTGGCPEAIDDACGIVTAEKTAESMRDAILELEKRGITREACIKRSELFDKAGCAENYRKLFEE